MWKKIAYFFSLIFFFGLFFPLSGTSARTNVTDWYIKDFDSQIVVNKNSTLDITETITADCGNAYNKHGIFRILPTELTIGHEKVTTPVDLISITDENGSSINYAETESGGTVTWKIGDADKTVQGVNVYKIHYVVKNVIRFGDPKFDELYWNLNGNFWELQTDHFTASITFPSEVNKQNATVDYYTGSLGSKSKDMASYNWSAPSVLKFESTKMLDVRQGITASVIFPKNIFTPYQPTFWEAYGRYLFLLIPLIVFLGCLVLWWKYGKDPRLNKTVIAEYEAPGNLSPVELGMLIENCTLKNDFITAEIINLATKGLITIEETHDKILFFDSKDYLLKRNEKPAVEETLNKAQKIILEATFSSFSERKLSDLKKDFYKNIPSIKKFSENLLEEKDLVVASGKQYAAGFMAVGIILIIIGFYSAGLSIFLGVGLGISGVIMLLFSAIMPKRTMKGAELNWQAKGFELFMRTVDKDRAKFYEKENIFEKFLPYAIMFDMTGLWIKRMQEIYGEEYIASHAPVWYVGSTNAFDADSFSSAMTSLSSDIAANTSAPSGSGGGGGAGGGGGGGGGGGW